MTLQTISVKQCEEIIDKLSDKTLSFGCILDIQDQNGYERRMIIDDVINTTKSIESWHEEDGTFHAIKINTIQKIIGHPILIGDIKYRYFQQCDGFFDSSFDEVNKEIDKLFYLCGDKDKGDGFTKSLNQILEEAEIIFSDPLNKNLFFVPDGTAQIKILRFNTPASNLFLFLNQLFN